MSTTHTVGASLDGTRSAPSLDAFLADARAFLEGCEAGARPTAEKDVERYKRIAQFKTRAEEEAVVPAARAWRSRKYDAGFGWICGPTAYGGRGLSEEYEEAYDELEGLYDAPNEDCFGAALEYVSPIVLQYGSEALKAEVLPRIHRGELVACQLFSEAEAGSDLAALRTRALSDGGSWIVSGQKVWTSRAHYSDIGLLLARSGEEEARHRAITAFLLDMHSPGVEVRPLRQMTGESPFNEVFFNDVVVPDGNRLGPVNEGWTVAMSTLGRERAALANRHHNRADGLSEIAAPGRVAELLRQCGQDRDPLRRQEWARIYIDYTVLRLTNQRIADAPPPGPLGEASRSMGKLTFARNTTYTVGVVSSVLGAHMTAETGEVWADRWHPLAVGTPALHIGGGTDEVVLNMIGERILGLPRVR